ncbi:hypothetical protein LO749_20835 [Paracoccus denitrificans]|uniref:phage nozzle protein n=1 Tax=Paracoccus denitrificans TaxID=266 RepID=UPI001E2AAB99|nr:hypothetical protein [Paracoccus denitrificans]UFS66941.1 hypothetical protein LO749_20835 [Paracoccus denitrificans]
MKITGGASNLINGVSRQTPDVRLTTQLEESVNQFPTITRGLVPRNPAIRMGGLPALRSGTLIHLIDRDASERYVAEIGNGSIRVWDLGGNPRTVNAPNGFGYVADAGEDRYQAVTVADHTFILNRNRTIQKGSAETAAWRQHALVHVVQASYHTEYTIKINGGTVAHLATGGGPHDDDEWAKEAERLTKTDFIASGLLNGREPSGADLPFNEGLMRAHETLFDRTAAAGTLDPAEWNVTRYGNVLHIVNKLGNDFEIEAFASDPNLIRAHKDTAPVYSELPKRAPHGFSLKINGDESSDHDDYYVVFDKNAGSGEGRWKEGHAPETQYRLAANTMPHLLVREEDGTFTFKPAEWDRRRVGDDDTNPWPSFVGKKASGLIYAQNRLGLYAGESIALSVHNSYFDFFKESLLARLDTDPVDLTIAHPEVSNILHGVPMGEEIVLFTTSVQFRLSANGERLTPDNGDIKPILSSTARSKSMPISLGTRLYFANDSASGSFLHEFTYDRESGVKSDPEDITSHVQGYLPGTVSYLCGDKDLRTLALVGRDYPRRLFIYRWMFIGADRVQSAWQRWEIPFVTNIRALGVMDENLIVVAVVPEGAEVLSINLHEGWRQGFSSPLYADRQVTVTGTYSADDDRTVFQVPVALADVVLNASPDGFGQEVQVEWVSDTEFSVSGDWSGKDLRVGFSYESYGILSPLLYRTTNNQGAYGNAVPGVDTWVSSVNFGSGNTAFLEVTVSRRYRPPYRIVLTPAQVTTETGWLGPRQVGRSTGTVSVMARTEDVQIRFGSTGSQPYEITGLSWSGNATPATL